MNALMNLNNNELELRLKDLVQKERKLLHVILEHIKELDNRKLYLERAYSSLYEYLTQELGYSGSAAMRRIEAARLLNDIPTVAEKIKEGALNLSQIGELSRSIKESQKQGNTVSCQKKSELIEMISGKSIQSTQQELAQALDLPVKDYDRQRVQQDESVRLEITLSKKQYEQLLQCKDLASHLLSQNQMDTSWCSVIEILAENFLADKKIAENPEAKSLQIKANKSITPKTRQLVRAKDRCCQYRDPQTNKLCGSTYLSQVDHKTSRWAQGGHEGKNLQLLCAPHNNLKYRQEAGLRSYSTR